MSRQVHRAPLALTSDGTVLVNVAEFDGRRDLAELLRKARSTRGRVFIGVEVDGREVALIATEAAGGVAEGVARGWRGWWGGGRGGRGNGEVRRPPALESWRFVGREGADEAEPGEAHCTQ